MSDFRRRLCKQLRVKLSTSRYRIEMRCGRVVRAWRYCIGRSTTDDAQTIMLDCRRPAGWYPLLILCGEDVLEEARTIYADHPELPQLIADGCARVEHKWESHNGELDMATRWAIDLAEEYARVKSIKLTLRDEDTDTRGDQVLSRVRDVRLCAK